MNRLECCGVVLRGSRAHGWFINDVPMKDAEAAVEIFYARIYNSSQELPRAITRANRKYAGLQLASAQTMVRRARERAGLTREELAKASGVSVWTIRRVERGDQDPRCKTMYHLTEACER